MNLPDFVEKYWRCRHSELLVGELPTSLLAERHGTPSFLYDRDIIERKYLSLRSALPGQCEISYSMKANPNPAFVRLLLGHGCGVEIASAGEFHLATAAGARPEDMLFAGPGKTDAELSLAVAKGLGEIHVESDLEVERISAISRTLGVRTRLGVRVNPTEEMQGGAMRMGGKSAPFGVDEEKLEPIVKRIATDAHLEFCGIHLFVGTQILDADVLLRQYRKGIAIARAAVSTAGIPLRTLDFGGGLGIPYFPGDRQLDLVHLSEGVNDLLADIQGEPCFAGTRFVIEPGRFLVGEAGVYVARVTDIKGSRGKKYLVLDGGMNHHLAASGNLGQVIKRNFPIAILNRLDYPACETFDVVGPLCTPLDTLSRSVQLPSAEVGDLVGIFQSGAYARAASPLDFLSHATPPEILVEGEQDFLIRRRGTVEDALRDIELLPRMNQEQEQLATHAHG